MTNQQHKKIYRQKIKAEQEKFTQELIEFYLERQENLARSIAARYGETID
jgi:hypothetical protein